MTPSEGGMVHSEGGLIPTLLLLHTYIISRHDSGERQHVFGRAA